MVHSTRPTARKYLSQKTLAVTFHLSIQRNKMFLKIVTKWLTELRYYSTFSISVFSLHFWTCIWKVQCRTIYFEDREESIWSRKKKRCKKLIYLYSPRELSCWSPTGQQRTIGVMLGNRTMNCSRPHTRNQWRKCVFPFKCVCAKCWVSTLLYFN